MNITSEEIYEELGLTPLDTFKCKAQLTSLTYAHSVTSAKDYEKFKHRRSGRTTKILVDAISHMCANENPQHRYYLMCPNRSQGMHLKDYLLDLFLRLNKATEGAIDVPSRNTIRLITPVEKNRLRGMRPQDITIVADHTIFEDY